HTPPTPALYTLSLHDALPISDDPLIRGARARDARDHVVQRLQAPVGLDPQVHFGRPGSDVVRDAEPAAPLLGGHRTGERGEQRLDRKSTRLNSSHVSISYAVF